MARLILPCKSSCLARTSLLGLISSAPDAQAQSAFRLVFLLQVKSGFSSLKNISRYRCFSALEDTCRRNYRFLHSSPYRAREPSRRLLCSVATEPLSKQVEESKMDAPKEIFLKDYKSPDYYFDTVDLKFSLGEEKTIVASKITVFPRVEGSSSPLVLDGVDLKLISIKVNGKELKEGDYYLGSRHLTLPSPPSGKFTLEIDTEINLRRTHHWRGFTSHLGISVHNVKQRVCVKLHFIRTILI